MTDKICAHEPALYTTSYVPTQLRHLARPVSSPHQHMGACHSCTLIDDGALLRNRRVQPGTKRLVIEDTTEDRALQSSHRIIDERLDQYQSSIEEAIQSTQTRSAQNRQWPDESECEVGVLKSIDQLRTPKSSSGYRGVQRLGRVFVAQTLLDARGGRFLGRFATANEAAQAIVDATSGQACVDKQPQCCPTASCEGRREHREHARNPPGSIEGIQDDEQVVHCRSGSLQIENTNRSSKQAILHVRPGSSPDNVLEIPDCEL